MAGKTNYTVNGKEYYRIRRKDGMKVNKNGKWVPNMVSFYGKNKSDAEKQASKYFARKKRGVNTEGYLGVVMEYYIDNVFWYSGKADGTKTRYKGVYEKYIKGSDLTRYRMSEVNSGAVQDFFNNLDATYSTKIAIRNILSLFFKYTDREGYCGNPMPSVEVEAKRNPPNEIIIFTKEEVDSIINSNSTGQHAYNRLLFLFALGTGLRQGEILSLKYEDIKDGYVKVVNQVVNNTDRKRVIDDTKTDNSVRRVPVPKNVLEQIEERRKNHKESDYIFLSKDGNFVDATNLLRSLRRFLKSIGLPYKDFHTFRRTYATTLCENGVDVNVVAELLGNTVAVASRYYTFISNESKERALEKINDMFDRKDGKD